MHFVIYCLDDPAKPYARDQHYAAHRAYLSSASIPIVVAGPLTDVAGERRIGSMLLVDARDLDEARAFAAGDPFHVNQVWKDVAVHPFIKAI
ncbi:YciI family protein [Burkholderia sp. Ac-20345]|uniref:YciI family protein n=1 Tax=Burkholderia sp. Ac-20345 TaxID=2703891 RepID=UPI00197B2DA5|nr:YciI family protein [Burkholderia sp. Ac-20345]MBN3780555.1 YciI family protein [Burkholderia sp. Ac-20345]